MGGTGHDTGHDTHPERAAAADTAVGPAGAPTPETVHEVLHDSPAAMVEAHLTWLVARTRREPQLSPQRVLFEDQSRILIDALEERGEHEAVIRTLQCAWYPDEVPEQDSEVAAYATRLAAVTAGQPGYSPYVALARSGARVSAEVLSSRGLPDAATA